MATDHEFDLAACSHLSSIFYRSLRRSIASNLSRRSTDAGSLSWEFEREVKREVFLFLLDAAWIRFRAERPSVSYTKVTSKVAWTGHNLQVTNKFKQQISGSNKFPKKGKREHQTYCRGASNEWMSGVQHRMQCRASKQLRAKKNLQTLLVQLESCSLGSVS